MLSFSFIALPIMKCLKNIIGVNLCRNCSGLSCPPLYLPKYSCIICFKEKEKNMNMLIKLELKNLVSIDTLYIFIINKGLMYINSAL